MLRKVAMLALLTIITSVSFAATKYSRLSCQYNDSTELERAIFKLTGTLTVINDEVATLSHNAIIRYPEGSDFGPYNYTEDNAIAFSIGRNETNVPYKGTKYTDHFKFNLEWGSVGAPLDSADLIISKRPVGEKVDKYGRTIKIFKGALDVSYNDHHGDTVWIICESSYYKEI